MKFSQFSEGQGGNRVYRNSSYVCTYKPNNNTTFLHLRMYLPRNLNGYVS